MTTYDQDTWGWKLQKWIQQSQEWWELQVRDLFNQSPKLPQITPPNLSILELILQGLLIIIAIFLIFWGILRIVRLVRDYYSSQPKAKRQKQSAEPELKTEEWLKRSQQFQQQEDYYQACRCLYLAMLQYLDDQHLLIMEKSRTDEEYSYLIFSNLPHPSPYETLLQIHQKLCFSSVKATVGDYNQCQQAYREIING
ncbi:MAG: DUF4129 domain-containing protein [Microcystaceae cyanobacterium]